MTSTAEPLTPPAPEPEEKKKNEPRPYVVLRQIATPQSPSDNRQVWEFVRNVEATSTEQAVRKAASILIAASDEALASVTLVAIAAKSFQPKTVSPETKTQLKLT